MCLTWSFRDVPCCSTVLGGCVKLWWWLACEGKLFLLAVRASFCRRLTVRTSLFFLSGWLNRVRKRGMIGSFFCKMWAVVCAYPARKMGQYKSLHYLRNYTTMGSATFLINRWIVSKHHASVEKRKRRRAPSVPKPNLQEAIDSWHEVSGDWVHQHLRLVVPGNDQQCEV